MLLTEFVGGEPAEHLMNRQIGGEISNRSDSH